MDQETKTFIDAAFERSKEDPFTITGHLADTIARAIKY